MKAVVFLATSSLHIYKMVFNLRKMQTTLVLVLNNIGEGQVYDEGMGRYWKEVPYKRKKGIRIHTEDFK